MNFPPKNKKIQWARSTSFVEYENAVEIMNERVKQIREGNAGELVWILEHPAIITAGTSANDSDLLEPERFRVFHSGRGGQYTYHGPGQLVAYVMLDLNQRGRDVRGFVRKLEQWLIGTLEGFDLAARRYDDRVGVWVDRLDGSEAKIAAIGIRIRRWVTFHGISLNVAPDLSHFDAIIPCGISNLGVTSFEDLQMPVSITAAEEQLKARFAEIFGPVEPCPPPA